MKDHVLPILVDRHSPRPIQSIVAAYEQGLCCSCVGSSNRIGSGVIDGVIVCGEASGREEKDVGASCLHERWSFDGAFLCDAVVVEYRYGIA